MSQTEVVRAILYTHQTNSACAAVSACNRKHQMEKTAMDPENQNFRKMNNTPEDIIVLQMQTINDNHT